ncbi:retrovirus-related pol polyprotein from transposon TNT 1-94 [Tanacetum coccineum]
MGRIYPGNCRYYSKIYMDTFLLPKDETPKVLKDFLTMIQRNLHAPVISVRTDRGTEFLNKTLNAFFKEEGIKHQTSTPQTPEQNDAVKDEPHCIVELLERCFQLLTSFILLGYGFVDPDHQTKFTVYESSIWIKTSSESLAGRTTYSSAEAEYVALSASCAQVMWMRTQLQDYGFNYNKIPLYCDSQSAIAISCNPVQHSRTKHIHTRYHFIKEQVENGIIELYFVRTEYQLADMFTKALPEERFQYLVRRIGMRCLTPAELEVLTKESA